MVVYAVDPPARAAVVVRAVTAHARRAAAGRGRVARPGRGPGAPGASAPRGAQLGAVGQPRGRARRACRRPPTSSSWVAACGRPPDRQPRFGVLRPERARALSRSSSSRGPDGARSGRPARWSSGWTRPGRRCVRCSSRRRRRRPRPAPSWSSSRPGPGPRPSRGWPTSGPRRRPACDRAVRRSTTSRPGVRHPQWRRRLADELHPEVRSLDAAPQGPRPEVLLDGGAARRAPRRRCPRWQGGFAGLELGSVSRAVLRAGRPARRRRA